MNQQSLSSQLFVLKKFEETCSDNQEVTMTPKKQVLPDEVVECPGAPLKESK
jgi:hypothetical protein